MNIYKTEREWSDYKNLMTKFMRLRVHMTWFKLDYLDLNELGS